MDHAGALAAIDDSLDVRDVTVGQVHPDGYRVVEVRTARGTTLVRHYESPAATRGVVWVGGIGGGFDSPGAELYPRLAEQLVGQRVQSARVRFRDPGDLEESRHDCLAGLWFLRQRGCDSLAAAGHSFGGAVVVQAAVADPTVRTVVTLATQSHGADSIDRLAGRCSLLAVHGGQDQVLPDACSRQLVDTLGPTARLIVFDRAGHVLDEVADELQETVLMWLVRHLSEDGAAPAR